MGVAGRADEIAAVHALTAGAVAGRSAALVVAGEAGVGKTSLIRLAADTATAIDVVWVTCLPLTSPASPLLPLRAALRHLDDAPVLERDTFDPMLVVDAWLERRAARRPVLLVVDDVQWADRGTLDVLMYVLAGAEHRRLAVVVARRSGGDDPPELRRWLAEAQRLPRVRSLALGRIDRAATADQLVFARTAGNPYLTRLLVRELPPGATELPPNLPDGLREAVAQTWRGLSAAARDLTCVLAVAGRPEPFETLRDVARAVGFHGPVLSSLAEAVEAGVLVADPGHHFWFAHPLLAEVLAATLLPPERRALHTAFATVLADGGTVDAARLSDHSYLAGGASPAYAWALLAAESASRPAERQRLLERALELHPRVTEPRMTAAELRWAIRWTAEAAGDDVTELVMVEGLLDELGPDPELAARRAFLRKTTGIEFLGLDDLRAAVRLGPASAAAHAQLAQMELWAGEPAGAKRSRTAVRLARAAGDPSALAHALIARSMAWSELNDPAGAANAEEALAAGRHYERVLAVFWIVRCSFDAASVEEVAGIFRAAWQRFTAEGLAHPYLARLASEEALFLLDLDRLPELRERLRFCLSAACGPMADAKVRLISAQLAARQGRLDDARAHLASAEEVVRARSTFLPFPFDVVRAELATATGDTDAVLTAVAAAQESGYWLPPLLPLAARALADQAQRARDRGDDPGDPLDRLTALRRRHPKTDRSHRGYRRFELVAAEMRQAWYEAETARAFDSQDAMVAWERAADAAHRAAFAWVEAYCRWRVAQSGLVVRAHRRVAVEALRRAHSLAVSLDCAPVLAEVTALAAAARVDLSTPATSLPDELPLPRLTAREREILPYVLAGRTYAEIARVLVISEKTVSVHVANMLRKVGVANRTELAILAQRAGFGSALGVSARTGRAVPPTGSA
jgi:DNA-binding CsgD family transcriptional regulator